MRDGPGLLFVVLGVLAVLILLIVGNEVVFQGNLFSNQTVGAVGGFAVLAAVIGLRATHRYRGQRKLLARHLAVWVAIIAAVTVIYWLLDAARFAWS